MSEHSLVIDLTLLACGIDGFLQFLLRKDCWREVSSGVGVLESMGCFQRRAFLLDNQIKNWLLMDMLDPQDKQAK